MHASWWLINPRERFENLFWQDIMKITSRRREAIRWVTEIWCMSLSDASSNENSRCKISSGQRKGEARKVASVAIIQCKEQEGGSSGSTKRKEGKSTMLRWWTSVTAKCGVKTKVPKVQRTSRAPRWRCKWRLGLFCCIYWAGFVCVTDDSSESDECHCESTWLFRTSSRCGICLHTRKMEDAPKLFKLPKSECPDKWIRLPRHKRPKSWSGIEDTMVLLERRLYGDPLAGHLWETIWGSFIEFWGKNTELGMSTYSSRTSIVLVGLRGWHQNGWTKVEYGFHVAEIDETRRSLRTNFLSGPCIFGMYSTWMQARRNYYWWIQNNVRVTNFCWNNWKMARVGKTSRKRCRVVVRHGKACNKMCWKMMRIGEQKDRATFQSLNSLFRLPSHQGRTGINWRIIKSMPTNCIEMLVLGTNW